jgi:hypothetical protein
MISHRWFSLPIALLGLLFLFDSLSYAENTRIEGVVERVFIDKSSKHDSPKAIIRFEDEVDAQSIGQKAFNTLKPGDRMLIFRGKFTGAWMIGDVYRSGELIYQSLKLNITPIFFVGSLFCIFSLICFVPHSWLGRNYERSVKVPLVVFGSGSIFGLIYYFSKMVNKGMLSDWYFAALNTSRKCWR